MPDGGYDDGYTASSCFWGKTAAELVAKAIGFYGDGRGRRALDIGCGEGKNAAAMAAAGFQVVAMDKSALAIANAMRAFETADVNWLVCDLSAISGPPKSFDLIVATGSLHCLASVQEIEEAIRVMRSMTKVSGLNVLYAFNDGPQDLSGHASGFHPTLLSHAQYLKCYEGWEIIQERNDIQRDVHPHNCIEHSHSITRILARRPM